VFGKKADWIKNACLAAVLLFPAVAALHGITLAALHVDGEFEWLQKYNDVFS
jgi:NO-binding membrane sensor protein with MHYT domain